MGKSERQKGQRGEREVAEEINKVFGVKWARVPGSGGMDIKGDVRRPFGIKKTLCDMFHWEVKFQEHLNIWEAFIQSERDALLDPTNPSPIVVLRRSRTPWRVLIDLRLFLELLLELQEWREKGCASEKEEKISSQNHLLKPLGAHPDTQKEDTYEDWVKEKNKHKEEQTAKKEKKKLLNAKYT